MKFKNIQFVAILKKKKKKSSGKTLLRTFHSLQNEKLIGTDSPRTQRNLKFYFKAHQQQQKK